jgi:hypothetical protein
MRKIMNPIKLVLLKIMNKTDTSIQPGPNSGIDSGSNKTKPKN